jgi:hypothetical protein
MGFWLLSWEYDDFAIAIGIGAGVGISIITIGFIGVIAIDIVDIADIIGNIAVDAIGIIGIGIGIGIGIFRWSLRSFGCQFLFCRLSSFSACPRGRPGGHRSLTAVVCGCHLTPVQSRPRRAAGPRRGGGGLFCVRSLRGWSEVHLPLAAAAR